MAGSRRGKRGDGYTMKKLGSSSRGKPEFGAHLYQVYETRETKKPRQSPSGGRHFQRLV